MQPASPSESDQFLHTAEWLTKWMRIAEWSAIIGIGFSLALHITLLLYLAVALAGIVLVMSFDRFHAQEQARAKGLLK